MLHRSPYRLNSRIATRRPQPGAMVAMRVLTFVPVQGANFSFGRFVGRPLDELPLPGNYCGEAGGFGFLDSRCGRYRFLFSLPDYGDDVRILALPKMFDEHDVAVLLFDLGEKEPMLVRRNC